MAFLVYKIVSALQKDTSKHSFYWEILKITNEEARWDAMYQNEISLIRPFGEMIKDAIRKSDTSLKIKMEL
jgi:hypothetical protein